MSLVFNLEDSIFNQFPDLKPFFNSLETKGYNNIDAIMWAIALDCHPKSSIRVYEEKFRRQKIEEDFLGVSIDWKGINEEINLFKDLCLSRKERFLIEWENKLSERQDFINKLEYNKDNADILDKMMGSTDKMWKQYLSCLKDVEEEESTAVGNSQESASEKGDI